jgi:hypothetical protein
MILIAITRPSDAEKARKISLNALSRISMHLLPQSSSKTHQRVAPEDGITHK